MDINVIISGNLTGFSRFYVSSGANEVMAESRFKFDTYSYLMFLRPGGKVYSITFSPGHIAASVITPILDSFRRPGTLVVSVLIPRNQKVERVSGQDNNRALYDLLTDLNDRFYEKNYKDGMINQNPAVLMQDYYSDIISRYTYVPDLNQKAININIDTEALTRKPGYVASAESNIPAYLSNLCRRSYEGFHYIFISPGAPQNIDEEPEEVLLYRVRIVNTNILLPEPVRLTQNIYPMQPGEGELDFEKNYTYQQVLAGQCQQISAVLTGETIEINYRFRQQEKKIRFEFYDAETNAPVDISLIRPSVESGSISRLLTSDSCIFLGTEIYSRFTMISKGSGYHIIDSIVDLRYISDGATVRVAVSKGCRIQKIFNAPYDISKTVHIRNLTGEEKVFFNVTEVFDEKITGQLCDWSYEITADGYEIAKGYLSSLVDSSSTFRMMPKVSVEKNAPTDSAIANPGAPKIFNGGGPLSGNSGKKSPKGLNWKKIATVAFAAVALVLCVVAVISAVKHKKAKDEAERQITIVVDFEFRDENENTISIEDAQQCNIALFDAGTDKEISYEAIRAYSYKVTAASACEAVLKFRVKLQDQEIQKDVFQESFVNIKQKAGEEMKCSYAIKLNSQIVKFINIHKDLRSGDDTITQETKDRLAKQISDLDSNLRDILTQLLKEKKVKKRVPDNSIDQRYDELYLTIADIDDIERDEDKNQAELTRIEAIKSVLKHIEEKKIGNITEDLIKQLSDKKVQNNIISQQDVIRSFKTLFDAVPGTIPEKGFYNMLDSNDHNSFYQIYIMIESHYPNYIVKNE